MKGGYAMNGKDQSVVMVLVVLLCLLVAGTVFGSNPIGRKPSKLNRAPAAAKLMPGQKSFIERLTGMEFIRVKGGCFQMGSVLSERNRDPDEGPVHQVCVDSFYMGKFEVTNGQYRLKVADHDSGAYNNLNVNGDWQPVLNISWLEAASYAAWLSEKTGMKFRLPTEAEWEYAARAGTSTARPWGNSPDAACGYANVLDKTSKRINTAMTLTPHNCDDGFPVTAPVGSKKPNAFGLYDMLGNVWEPCSDWYRRDYYAFSQGRNPKGAGAGNTRVLRGGSWSNEPRKVRVANRGSITPALRDALLGIRLVLDAK